MKLTGEIIGAAMEVHRVLGPGFVEAIYQRALLHELKLRGFIVETEQQLGVRYKDAIVGVHRLDIVVNKVVIVELKAVTGIIEAHRAQAISYLKASGLNVALILNFGEPSLAFKRVVYELAANCANSAN
jgi:GxxExxY protein